MDKPFSLPYIPGKPREKPAFLERFIQPYQAGVVSAWLREHVPAGSLVLDPFCSNPLFALEAAAASYRVVVTCNNPAVTLMLETLAAAPTEDAMRLAVNAMDMDKPGSQRVSSQLRALYQSECHKCGGIVDVRSFLWRRGESFPFAKQYNCAQCGDDLEEELSDTDKAKLTRVGNAAMYYSRALSRVDIGDRDVQEGAQEALKSYSPRAIYSVFTLLNRIEGMKDARQRQLLQTMILHVLDAANSLWPWPSTRSRPRQLVLPPQYRENNLWLSLEESISLLTDFPYPVKIVPYGSEHEPGTIALFRGRLKEMLEYAPPPKFDSTIMLFPRPNQAFWTLSAMWSGWLFGKEAVKPLKSALERERYDWFWLSNSLQYLFKQIEGHLVPEKPSFGMVSDIESGYAVSVLNALKLSRLHFDDIALRTSAGNMQFEFSPASQPGPTTKALETAARDTIRTVFQVLGEPQTAQRISIAAMTGICFDSSHGQNNAESAGNQFKTITMLLQRLFDDRTFLYPLEDKSLENERAYWGLAGESFQRVTQSDQVELALLSLLQEYKTLGQHNLDQMLCAQFPGFRTPQRQLVMECLDSYADLIEGNTWSLRPQELEQNRQADAQAVTGILTTLGTNLGFTVRPVDHGLQWLDGKGKPTYHYRVIVNAAISPIIIGKGGDQSVRECIVLPGSRAKLLAFKLLYNKPLADLVRRDWQIIKYRTVHHAADETDLTLSGWDTLIDLDPPTHDEPIQMSFFTK